MGNKIEGLIKGHENKEVELKQSFRWNPFTNQVDKSLPSKITKEICAFLNSEGGKLIIGVEDNKEIVGIKGDIQSYNSKELDKGKDLLLTDIGEKIRKHIGIKVNNYYRIEFKKVGDKEIIIIHVRPYKHPVLHSNKDLYVRITNSTKRLTKREAFDYYFDNFDMGKNRSTLEYYLFILAGYLRLTKNIIEKKLSLFCSLITVFFIFSGLWSVYLFINYEQSKICLNLPFIPLSCLFMVLSVLSVSKYKERNQTGKKNKNPFRYVPKINLGYIGVVIILTILSIFLLVDSFLLIFPLIFSNLWGLIVYISIYGVMGFLIYYLNRIFKNLFNDLIAFRKVVKNFAGK